MRYMLLIYTQEEHAENMTPDEYQSIAMIHRDVMGETERLGILKGAEPLASTSTATTVRMKDGRAMVTDGPFAETKEQLAGYYLLDCQNLDEAIQWASKIPTACGGGDGCIEIRPIRTRST
jgi:hypothetical protein